MSSPSFTPFRILILLPIFLALGGRTLEANPKPFPTRINGECPNYLLPAEGSYFDYQCHANFLGLDWGRNQDGSYRYARRFACDERNGRLNISCELAVTCEFSQGYPTTSDGGQKCPDKTFEGQIQCPPMDRYREVQVSVDMSQYVPADVARPLTFANVCSDAKVSALLEDWCESDRGKEGNDANKKLRDLARAECKKFSDKYNYENRFTQAGVCCRWPNLPPPPVPQECCCHCTNDFGMDEVQCLHPNPPSIDRDPEEMTGPQCRANEGNTCFARCDYGESCEVGRYSGCGLRPLLDLDELGPSPYELWMRHGR